MTYLEAAVSGIVQGVTEFLPVSSSGHLVLVHKLFGFQLDNNLFFDICLHMATLLAVIVYFRKDIIEIFVARNVKLILLLMVATIPAVLAGFFLESEIKRLFQDADKVAWSFIITSCVLFLGQVFIKKAEEKGTSPKWGSSLLVGFFQAFALAPGISRSGMTVSAALIGGMKPKEAFRFSFLLSIPVIFGAALYELTKTDLTSITGSMALNFAVGIICAFTAGFLSLRLLWVFISKRKLYVFAIYCFLLGVSGIIFWAR